MGGKHRPACETVRPRDHELGIGQRAARTTIASQELLPGELLDLPSAPLDLGWVRWRIRVLMTRGKGVQPPDGPCPDRGGVPRPARLHEVLCKLSVVLEVRAGRKRQGILGIRYMRSSFQCSLESARSGCPPSQGRCEASERSSSVPDQLWVGTALSADWMRPSRSRQYTRRPRAGQSPGPCRDRFATPCQTAFILPA